MAVNLVGRGRIGAAVAEWLAHAPGYRLQDLIGRGACGWQPAPLTIDTAGPGALRDHGERLLAEGDLWTVGAAALVDTAFSERLHRVAQSSGNHLRLFTATLSGPARWPEGSPVRLQVRQSAPGLGPAPGIVFDGPLAEAALRFPDHLNTPTAAALAGPGIAATSVRLTCTQAGSPHVLALQYRMPGTLIETEARFALSPDRQHPVATAIIAALQERAGWLRSG